MRSPARPETEQDKAYRRHAGQAEASVMIFTAVSRQQRSAFVQHAGQAPPAPLWALSIDEGAKSAATPGVIRSAARIISRETDPASAHNSRRLRPTRVAPRATH